MPDSSLTKKSLADSLKSLMKEVPFNKITVGLICERIRIQRQGFYYHFHDKYDLVIWIFKTELSEILQPEFLVNDDPSHEFELLCNYFFENRGFYRSLLKDAEPNSFWKYFHNQIALSYRKKFNDSPYNDLQSSLAINFLADAVTCAIARWISDRNMISPELFVQQMDSLGNAIRSVYNQDFLQEKT